MDILNLVDYVNKKLHEGLSTAKLEKEMQLGKDTLRKKLNRAGYKFSKDLKQYIKEDFVTQDNTVSYNKEKDVYNKEKENAKNGDTEIMDIKFNKKKSSLEKLTDDEINFIKMLYKQHQQQKNINDMKLEKIITRSIRVDQNAIESFADYCKKNNLNQSKVLSKILLDFIKNN